MQKQKLAWFVGYLALRAQRNKFKKSNSASLMVSSSATTIKTMVNYPFRSAYAFMGF